MLPYQIAPTNGDPSHDGVRDTVLPPLANTLLPPRRHAEGRMIRTTAKKHHNSRRGANLPRVDAPPPGPNNTNDREKETAPPMNLTRDDG